MLAELLEYAGHSVPSHMLDAELAWLEDVGALVLQRKDGFSVATLTTPGLDITRDACQLPGIARLSPEGSIFKQMISQHIPATVTPQRQKSHL